MKERCWREMSREVPREGEREDSGEGEGRDKRGEERDCDKKSIFLNKMCQCGRSDSSLRTVEA